MLNSKEQIVSYTDSAATKLKEIMKEQHKEVLAGQLLRHEGLELILYKCPAGKWTIGAGRNLEDRGITEEEALYLLRNDIISCISELDHNFRWWKDLSENRRIVMGDLMFNLGLSKLKQFKKFLAAMESGDYETASEELLDSRYAKQLPNRSGRTSQIIKDG